MVYMEKIELHIFSMLFGESYVSFESSYKVADNRAREF